MTFTETKGFEPFNWEVFLNSNPDKKEVWNAVLLAGSWNTCAVGNLDERIRRYKAEDVQIEHCSAGQPIDEELRKLGTKFSTCVNRWHYYYWEDAGERGREEAMKLLAEIKHREKELLEPDFINPDLISITSENVYFTPTGLRVEIPNGLNIEINSEIDELKASKGRGNIW